MCAEGGTERGHSEVIFQSKRVDGPYTPCLINPILTQRDLPNGRENMVACTGHADLVQSAAGSWYAVFLGTMPYDGDYAFNTGRQTFLLPVTWTDAQQPVILEQGKPVPLVVDMTDDMKSLVAKNTIEGFDGYRPGPLWDGDGLKDFVLFLRNPVAQGGKSTDAFDLRQSLKKGPFDIDDKPPGSCWVKSTMPIPLSSGAANASFCSPLWTSSLRTRLRPASYACRTKNSS